MVALEHFPESDRELVGEAPARRTPRSSRAAFSGGKSVASRAPVTVSAMLDSLPWQTSGILRLDRGTLRLTRLGAARQRGLPPPAPPRRSCTPASASTNVGTISRPVALTSTRWNPGPARKLHAYGIIPSRSLPAASRPRTAALLPPGSTPSSRSRVASALALTRRRASRYSPSSSSPRPGAAPRSTTTPMAVTRVVQPPS